MDSGLAGKRPRPGMTLAPGNNRRAALLVVPVDLHPIPDAVEVIRIAARERIDGGAVLGVDDKDTSDRRLAVIGHQCARGDHIDSVILGAVEMDAMRAIMFGARR